MQVVLAMLFSVIAMAVNYLISLVLTPYITATLGKDVYGFVTLAKTTANYGIVITSCLNAFAARYIVVAYHENDMEKTNRYYSSVVLADVAILVIVSLLAVIFVQNLQVFYHVPEDILGDVKLLFFLDIVNYLALTLANVYTVAAYIHNRLMYVNLIKIAGYAAEAAALLILFYFLPAKVYYVGVALIFSSLILGGLNFGLKQKLEPRLQCHFKDFSLSAVKDLIGRGIWNSLNQVGNLLNSGLDLWVTNLMLTDLLMGDLSLIKTVAVIFSTLPGLISSPFQPTLLKAYANKNLTKVSKTLRLEMKLTGLCGCLLLTGFTTLGYSYFELWTPGQDSRLLFWLSIVTLIGFVFEGMANPLFYVYSLTLKNTLPCIVTILSGCLNVGGMYLLLKYTGLELFAVVGTTTVLGFFNFMIFTPLYSAHCMDLSVREFCPVMLRIAGSSFAIAAAARLLVHDIMAYSWGSFVIYALIVVVICLPIYLLLVLNKEERSMVIGKIRKRKNAE